MKLIKAGLLVVLFLVVLGTGTSVATAKGILKPPAWITDTLAKVRAVTQVAAPIPPAMSEQVSILSDRLNNLGQHSDQVLGAYVQKTPEHTPIYQKTIDYARYVYCQQAIREYEAQYSPAWAPATATPSTSPVASPAN